MTVIGKLPATVGVPERTPAVESDSPAGSEPLASVNVAVPCAPLCVKVSLNAASTVPVAFTGFVTVMVWQLMTRLYVGLTPVQPLLSVTRTVMEKLPLTVGVPERTPAVDSVRPAGSEPLLSENVAVPCAPLCEKFWLNGASTVPVVVAGFVTVMVWQAMLRLYVAPSPKQPLVSVARTTIGKLPLTVGVPERRPLEGFRVRPAGSVPLAREYVTVPRMPPEVNVSLKAASTVPLALAGFVTVMVWQLIVRLY